jgi:hypothetical protein
MTKKKEIKKSEMAPLFNPEAIRRNKPSISYINLPGDKVMVTGIDGFLTMDNVENIYGKVIADIYCNSDIKMRKEYLSDGKVRIQILNRNGQDGERIIKVGSNEDFIFTKDEFSNIINLVKQCGKRLHDIIEAMKQEEKVINI